MKLKAGSMDFQKDYDYLVCCICNSNDYSIIAHGPTVQIIKCSQCGLMRQGKKILNKNKYVFDFDGGAEHIKEQVKEKEDVQIKDHLTILNTINKQFPNKGKLLEIGCSTGKLLNEIRTDGWQVSGVEPQEWSCEIAREKYNLDVINSTIDDAGIKENTFDVILLIHVIEHLISPYESIKFIQNLLTPGGILVIETPRYDSFMFRVLKGRERSVIPGHLYYFTSHSLINMSTKADYQVVKYHSVGRTVTLDRLCYYAAKFFNSIIISKYLMSISSKLKFNKIRLYFNLHDMIRLYIKNV